MRSSASCVNQGVARWLCEGVVVAEVSFQPRREGVWGKGACGVADKRTSREICLGV